MKTMCSVLPSPALFFLQHFLFAKNGQRNTMNNILGHVPFFIPYFCHFLLFPKFYQHSSHNVAFAEGLLTLLIPSRFEENHGTTLPSRETNYPLLIIFGRTK
uniref:Putative secreted peptide n=1 Tax=Anopheles braziliensis TaxID=58242 RepID=A0A2M3ZUR1_9DIPT